MATRVDDRLPDGEEDPLKDEPVEAPEPALDEAPAPIEAAEEAEEAPEEAPDEVDWKKRYDDLRVTQTRTAQERNEATQRAEQALALAKQVYEATQRAQATPAPQAPTPDHRVDPELAALRAQAEDMGITQEQLAYLEKLSDAKAQAAVGNFQQQYYTEQQQAAFQQAQQAAEQEITNVREQFLLAHPDAMEKQEDILDFMRQIGVVEHLPNGRDQILIENFSVGDLEAAYEAVQNDNLRLILAANPHLYQSDEGMEYARRQMQLDKQRAALASLPGVAPTPDATEREAALAAAETLPASHGPSPTSGEPPQDIFDDVLQYQQRKRKSVFST